MSQNKHQQQQHQHQAVSGVNEENFSHFAWAHKFTSHTHTHTLSFLLLYHFSSQSSSFFSKFIASSCHNLITNVCKRVCVCVNVVFFCFFFFFFWMIFMNEFSRYCYLFRLHNIMLDKCCSQSYQTHTHTHICTTSVLRVVFFPINSPNDSLELVCARIFLF